MTEKIPHISNADKELYKAKHKKAPSGFGGGIVSQQIAEKGYDLDPNKLRHIDPEMIRNNENNFFHIDANVDIPAMAAQIVMNNYIAPGLAYESDTDQSGNKDGRKFTLLGGETRWLALQKINQERKAEGKEIMKFPLKIVDPPKSKSEELLLIMADNQTRTLNSDDKSIMVYNLNNIYDEFKAADNVTLAEIKKLESDGKFDEAEQKRASLYLPVSGNAKKMRKDEWMAEHINRTNAFGKKTSARVVSRYLRQGKELMNPAKKEEDTDKTALPDKSDIHEFDSLLRKFTGLNTRSNKHVLSLLFSAPEDVRKFLDLISVIDKEPDSLNSREKEAYSAYQTLKNILERPQQSEESEDVSEGEKNGKTN